MHEGLRDGITAKNAKIEGWPTELSLNCLRGDPAHLTNSLSGTDFLAAADAALIWQDIEAKHSSARTIRSALAKAPLMPDLSSSILHVWQALENVIRVQSEVTYRSSLMLAQLCAPIEPRASTYAAAKKSYSDRSKIAHGSTSPIAIAQWMRAWDLLRNSCQAILHRRNIPSAEDLTHELLTR